jgi:hypothetical protein
LALLWWLALPLLPNKLFLSVVIIDGFLLLLSDVDLGLNVSKKEPVVGLILDRNVDKLSSSLCLLLFTPRYDVLKPPLIRAECLTCGDNAIGCDGPDNDLVLCFVGSTDSSFCKELDRVVGIFSSKSSVIILGIESDGSYNTMKLIYFKEIYYRVESQIYGIFLYTIIMTYDN